MDLMYLDANMQANKPVQNMWDSLVWTERFNTVGDFILDTGYVKEFMTWLPEGTFLTLRDSNCVMQVETHEITRAKNKPEKLQIKGRALEKVLDQRVAIKSFTDISEWTINLKTPSDVAYYLIGYICVMGSLDPNDVFPTSKLVFPTPADYLTSTGPVKTFSIPRGNLLSTVLSFLQQEAKADPTTSPATPAVVPHGIRAVRPNASGTAVSIEIYTGVDRRNTLYFDGRRDLLDDGKYLFSKVGSADTAYVLGAKASAKMNKKASASSGFERRVILLDATNSGVDDLNVLKEQTSMSLAEAHETAIFDGVINNDLNPYVYGRDFNLGDILRLQGDYGLSQSARCTEFIRTEDATGYKAYPAFETIPE